MDRIGRSRGTPPCEKMMSNYEDFSTARHPHFRIFYSEQPSSENLILHFIWGQTRYFHRSHIGSRYIHVADAHCTPFLFNSLSAPFFKIVVLKSPLMEFFLRRKFLVLQEGIYFARNLFVIFACLCRDLPSKLPIKDAK